MPFAHDVDICCFWGDKECAVQIVEKSKGEKLLQTMGRTLFRGKKMKIKVLERTSNELKIEIEGVGHSFCNVLQKALLDEDGIDMTGYHRTHPLVSNPTVYVRTKGQLKPETAIRDAVKRIRKRNKDFGKIFEKALKERQQELPSTTSARSPESNTTPS